MTQKFSAILNKLNAFYHNEKQCLSSRDGELSKTKYYSIVAIIFLFAILIYYPGFFSNDSLGQWHQAQTKNYDTWHPIIMAVIWRYTSKIFGVGSFFMLNQAMYWFGIAYFIDLVLGRRLRYLGIAFFPPLLMMSFNVWKDVACMTGMTLATAFFISWLKCNKRYFLLLSGIFLVYACLVRLNGFIPAAALVFIGALCFLDLTATKRIIYSIAITLLLCVAAGGSNYLINKIYKPHIARPIPSVVLWDIAGIYINAGMMDAKVPEFTKITDETKAKTWLTGYNPGVNSICWVSGVSCNARSAEEDKQYLTFWFNLIKEHPKAYLKHRAHIAKIMYGFQKKIYYPYHSFDQNHQVGGDLIPSHIGDAFYKKMNKIFHALEKTRLFHPWIWMLICIAIIAKLLFNAAYNKQLTTSHKLALALSVSGLANALSLFIITAAADYRYLIWTVMAGMLSLALIASKNLLPKKNSN